MNKTKFNHIGIFSKNIKFAEKELKNILNIKKTSKTFIDKNLGVKVKFLYDKDSICYEIVSPYGKKNPVDKVLKEGKNILNHLAYKVKNFDKVIKDLRNQGFVPLMQPKKAKAFNSRVIFFLSPLKVIIEIVEEI
tara:strand:- start:52 stop:456 length:405 start_codon:yes stop_codon:yes gene_type:complete